MTSTQFDTGFRRLRFYRRPRFWICSIIGMLMVGLLILPRFFRPVVDPERTRPVVIAATVDDAETSLTLDQSAGEQTPNSIAASITPAAIQQADHPLDPLLALADRAIAVIDESVYDYTATMSSQVRVDGELQAEKCLHLKIRHARTLPDGKSIPFSVYTSFLKPADSIGQEVIWVDGWNEGNLVVHLSGWTNLMKFYLDPDGPRAMAGNRYPIRDIGFRNLIVKMKEIGARDRKHGNCSVLVHRNLKMNDRACTMIEAIHPNREPQFEFHIARIYIDDQNNLPIAYEGYTWPEQPNDPPPLLEKYYYTDIELNVGLKDIDFDPANQEYNFPAR